MNRKNNFNGIIKKKTRHPNFYINQAANTNKNNFRN